MKRQNYTTKALVQDAMFSAICLFLILIFSTTSNNWKMYCFSLVVLMSIFYYNLPLNRVLICSITVTLLSFIIANPLNVIVFVVPNCIIGVLSSRFVGTKFKFLCPLFFIALLFYETVTYAYVFLDKNLITFFKDLINTSNPTSNFFAKAENTHLFIFLVFCFLFLIGIIETSIYFVLFNFFKKRLKRIKF